MIRQVTPLLLAGLTAGCVTVGPDYARPPVDIPPNHRGQVPVAASLADEQWPAVFKDDRLREVIATALGENYDVRIAAARIVQAEAALGIARSNQVPIVNAHAVAQGQRSSIATSDGEAHTAGLGQLGASIAWEADFWGKYRRATEAGRARLLASEWGRRAVVTSLISEVAIRYYTLLSLDLELSIATRTLGTREESLRLTQVRERGGETSLVDVRQAEQLVFGVRTAIIDLQRLIEQQENALSVLLGRNPGPIPRGQPLVEIAVAPEVPAGLPSVLLERRPDIQVAEHLLVAANAEIGSARAAYFPEVILTGSGGLASAALSALVSGPAAAWTIATAVVQPIFNGGRTRSEVALAEARRDEAILSYRQTVQNALREVSDALIQFRRTTELREAQQRLVDAALDARRLAGIRYQGGRASYLEVLDSDTRLFGAELELARARLGQLTSFVEVYRALGGGWSE